MSFKEHRIAEITDLLNLSSDELARFLPDLLAWHELSRDLKMNFGAEIGPVTWVDDERPGEIHHYKLINKDSGEEVIVKGSAYSEASP